MSSLAYAPSSKEREAWMGRRGATLWLVALVALVGCGQSSDPSPGLPDAGEEGIGAAERGASGPRDALREPSPPLRSDTEVASTERRDDTWADPERADHGGEDALTPLAEDLGPVDDVPEDFGPGFTPLSGVSESAPFWLFFGDDEELPTRTGAFFGDMDGDGNDEVIVSGSDEAYTALGTSWTVTTTQIYRYDAEADALVEASDLPMKEGHVLAVADFDGDGRDDVLLQGPSGIEWGGEDVNGAMFLDAAGGEHVLEWKGIGLADLDDDGLVDLLAQPAYCCSLECPELIVVLATGRRHYTAKPELIETVNHANVCSTLVAPLGDRRLMMSYAAVGSCGGMSHVFYDEVARDAEGYPRLEALEAAGPKPTLDLALAAPMGGSVGDVDGDGDLDLTITIDPQHALFRSEESFPLTNMSAFAGIGEGGFILPNAPLAPDRFMIPWGASFLDVDRDGRVDLLYTHGADPNPGGGKEEKKIGPQHVTAHWNRGGWQFGEITHALNLGLQGDWRGFTVGDLDRDGDPDLGIGGLGRYPQVYRNDVDSGNQGLSLRLKGTTSNPLGLGALVRVQPTPGAPIQTHLAGHMGNPYGVSEPLVFVGLGGADSAHSIEITWPSGFVQSLSGLEAAQLHEVEEPVTIALSPWSRRLEASGSESAFIEAYARTPDGAIDEGAEVTMSIVYGLGTASEGVPFEGGTRWEIPPPGIVGTSVIEVKIDGVALTVRPRIFWF